MKLATEEFLKQIDELAEKRKEEIRSAKSQYPTNGQLYYVSESGNDENDGRSPETAIKTIDRLNEIELAEGDTVLFRRGDLFRGHIAANTPHVTYSAYGEGAKPIISGSPENGGDESKWTLVEGTHNVYRYETKMMDVGGILFNDGEVVGIKKTPRFCKGTYVNPDNTPFDIKKDLDENFSFFIPICDEIWEGRPVFSHPENVGYVYLRCDAGNPGALYAGIEFFARGNTIAVGADYVTVDNLHLTCCGTHSIGSGNRTGLTVRNTEIGWGGGCLHYYNPEGYPTRFGNGIEIYVACKDFTVENCYIYQIYDAGVTHQYKGTNPNGTVRHENVLYKDNLIEYCIYNIEYFLEQDNNEEQIMKNVLMTGNILRFAGYGWGAFYSRAAHIKGWDHRNISENFVIENNIFDRSRAMILHCGVQEEKHLPTVRNNVYIHYKSGIRSLGRFSERGGKVFGYPPERLPYDDDVIRGTVKDGSAEIYYAEGDHKCDGYWPAGMKF